MSSTPRRGCSCSCIISLPLTVFTFYITFKFIKPISSIEQIDAFTLNNTIRYDLKLNNKNIWKGIYYDTLNLAFFYKPNLTSSYPIGNATYPAFYQGHHKTAHRIGNLDVARGISLENVIVGNGTAVFRVELASAIRFKTLFWNIKSKRHRYVVAATLEVNDQGRLVKKKSNKGVKMTSQVGIIKAKVWFHVVAIFIFILFC